MTDCLHLNQNRPIPFFTSLVIFGLIVSVLFCSQTMTSFILSYSIALLTTLSSLCVGGLIGFLFGIPKKMQIENYYPNTSSHNPQKSYQPNTNLEEISDWLTKIIVGLGLTQISDLISLLKDLSNHLSFGFGDLSTGPVFLQLLIIYNLICGFIIFYLWSRLYLIGAFKEADSTDFELLHGVIAYADTFQGTIDSYQKEKIENLKNRAIFDIERNIKPIENAITHIKFLGEKYENLRNQMNPGPKRTFQMNEIMSNMRSIASSSSLTSKDAHELFNANKPGYRIASLAILQVIQSSDCLDMVISAITGSYSAFEQYQALRAASQLIENLRMPQMKMLKEVIENELQEGTKKHISRDNERRGLALKILRKLSIST